MSGAKPRKGPSKRVWRGNSAKAGFFVRLSPPAMSGIGRRPGRPFRLLIFVAAVGAVANGCGNSSPNSASSNAQLREATTTTVPTSGHTLVTTFSDNGGTLTASVGDIIRVVLAGESWQMTTSNRNILEQRGKSNLAPITTGCVPGQGCGSVSTFYKALKAGDANLLASRSSCRGSPKGCKTGNGVFRLTVQVKSTSS